MSNLGLREIFGNGAVTNIDPVGGNFRVTLDLGNLANAGDGSFPQGQIENGLGISQLFSEAAFMVEDTPPATSKAYKILYGILLMIMQNQAESLNADPEQKIYISSSTPRVATGDRAGQVQRSFTVYFFSDDGVLGVPDIDDL